MSVAEVTVEHIAMLQCPLNLVLAVRGVLAKELLGFLGFHCDGVKAMYVQI